MYVQMESSERHEYPSHISTFYDKHTHDGVWAQEDARLQYEETIRLRDLGADTPTGVPYTEEKILAMVRKGKQWGHILGVGRQVTGQGKSWIFDSQPHVYSSAEMDAMLTERD
ncbi:hypothetical protein Tco_0805750 [Tanacetum coccineum]|uniref:Uncharacterized protein n=1 Tax=Tanacetum coccineum TaxID=301880 RepID=A0ABQ5F822_9ASTR